MLNIPPSATRYDLIQLGGGLDQLTPTLRLRPGVISDGINWEQSIAGGYTRIAGYERFDGRTAPSAANYASLTLASTGAVLVGDTIAGVSSGATGVIIWRGGNVATYTRTVGAFVIGETINVAGTPRATITDTGGSDNLQDFDARQRALAANVYRASIQVVPGSGPIRGGFVLNGVNYAIRNNVGGTALAFYQSSAAGWVLVPFKSEVSFTLGTSQYLVGSSVVMGAVSAVVRGVALESGSWAGGTAAGRLIIDAPIGGNFAAGISAGGGASTLGGIQAAITLAPGGRVVTETGNFGGGVKIYGADGVNVRPWEFDGTTLIPLNTGNSVAPKHPCVHKDHLFFAFGALLQHSGITTPYNWTSIAGGAIYRCNGVINAITRQPGSQAGGALSLGLVDSTEMLYGNSAADFQKVSFEQSGGARQYGTQRLSGQSYAYGDTGVMAIAATQSFGNFSPSSLTMNIRPFTQIRRSNCTASLVNREKSQYRVFFGDAYGLYITIVNGRLVGSMPVFFPEAVAVAWQGNSANGVETSYFGGASGYVFTLDSGTSHDGAEIASFMTITFANQGNSRVLKRYRGAEFEVQGDGYAEFGTTFEVGYGTLDRSQGGATQTVGITLATVRWDEFVWDQFTWDGKSLSPSHCELSGTGENIAIRVDSSSDKFLPFTLNSVVVHYSMRKALKS